jgi:hypothetical protein
VFRRPRILIVSLLAIFVIMPDDAAAVMDRPSLYEHAQIDRERYTSLAVDLKSRGPTTAMSEPKPWVPGSSGSTGRVGQRQGLVPQRFNVFLSKRCR